MQSLECILTMFTSVSQRVQSEAPGSPVLQRSGVLLSHLKQYNSNPSSIVKSPSESPWIPKGGLLSFFQLTLQLASDPTPGPCSSHAYLLIDSLQDGPCLIASASGEFHCLKAVGGADVYQLCTGQSWGIYWYPGANSHHASIYTQEISKQISGS